MKYSFSQLHSQKLSIQSINRHIFIRIMPGFLFVSNVFLLHSIFKATPLKMELKIHPASVNDKLEVFVWVRKKVQPGYNRY